MVTANELRIGNLINYKGSPIPVTMIGEYGIQSANDGRIINAKFSTVDLTGIPLTEELLLMSGFEKHTEQSFSIEIDNGWKIIWETNGYIYLKYLENECEVSHKEYKFLHEIQNLISALTNTELTLKTK